MAVAKKARTSSPKHQHSSHEGAPAWLEPEEHPGRGMVTRDGQPTERVSGVTATIAEPMTQTAQAKCEVCGNEYDKAFTVTIAGGRHTFDSFECAIKALAPTCGHCGCKVIGHGVEKEGAVFCCAHCAEQEGAAGLKDRV